MKSIQVDKINFDKMGGLVPVCVQDSESLQVLMIGFMNEAALRQTLETNKVTFYSRSKQRLWTKGEQSGCFLLVKQINADCDDDSLLILATATGPACHKGTSSCFQVETTGQNLWQTLAAMNEIIKTRQQAPRESYTRQLLDAGLPRLAQKVGEEGVEVALAAVVGSDEEVVNEVVDLLYHVFVLLFSRGISQQEIGAEINKRMRE